METWQVLTDDEFRRPPGPATESPTEPPRDGSQPVDELDLWHEDAWVPDRPMAFLIDMETGEMREDPSVVIQVCPGRPIEEKEE